ncbi:MULTISPECIES: HlyD family type I secretion periplasmic adaptor subunit [Paracoccaceae]|uniref:Membrane fusion protein (MFP) family protein n=1 Tax=Pukyongiella litopenaei TaxID=2605946 RepID=A0A2S0MTT7_9RHOB|nr:HlyD family type I secretion periplasmic adaptor subunit [Pukyongiella litopenaei]AVO39288.1 HlyD family type I secretion periplasmic adaptor subunit [Pukyongiella litopenaei]
MSRQDWELRDFAQGAEAARLGSAHRALTFALVLVITLAGLGLAWAAWATLEEVARAQGRVVPSGRARTVESLEGGVVREIHVAEGDEVVRGDVLVRIDDTSASTNLGELVAQHEALLVRTLRLETEAAGIETLDFSSSAVAEDAPIALREKALFDNRLASYIGQRAVLEAQIDQARQEVSKLGAAMLRIDESLALLSEEIDLKTASGVIPRTQILPLERERSAKRQERDNQESLQGQARAALRESEARLRELELKRQAEISAERAETQSKLEVIEETMKRATSAVNRASLRAPVNGLVTQLNVNTIDEVVKPGEEVLRIVPLEDSLQVEARVRPEDIAFIRPGLSAKVKLTSFDFTIYGALEGEVTRIGADAKTDEATGEIYFPIVVETASTELRRGDERHEIRPGMVATVDILTGERTVLDYILKPLRKARAEALRER